MILPDNAPKLTAQSRASGGSGALNSLPTLTGPSCLRLLAQECMLGFQTTSCLTLPSGPHPNSPRSPRLPRSWETRMCLGSTWSEEEMGRENPRTELRDHRLPEELRQAGSWDPLLQFYDDCTGTHLSSSDKIQRNCMGLKITACMQLGQILDKRDQKTQLPLLKSPEHKQGTAHAPCTHRHLRGGQTTRATPPAQPLDTPLPSPHIRNQLPPPWGASNGTCCLFSLLLAAAGAPVKPCLNFLSGLGSISIDWGRPRTLTGIRFMVPNMGHLSPSRERIWTPPGPVNSASPWVTSGHLNLLFQHHHI